MTNPVNYTSRTFQTILADFNADDELVDKPDWFKRAVAGVGDVASMYINAAANDSYLRTAFTRRAVVDLCAQNGYNVPNATTSSGTMFFYLVPSATLPQTIDVSDLAASTRGTIAVSSKRFEARSGVTVTAITTAVNLSTSPISGNAIAVSRDFLTGEKVRITSSGSMPSGLTSGSEYFVIRMSSTSIKLAATLANAFAGIVLTISGGSGTLSLDLRSFRVTCYQQEVKSATLGTSDGSTAWQQFDLPDIGVIDSTIAITINGTAWTAVDTLATSHSYETHYRVIFKTDGSCYIEFGNGDFGAVPGNFDIESDYAIGGGTGANISALNSVSVYAGGSSVVSGCANATAFTGGGDAQASETAKRIAPGTVKAQNRFVTREDGISLALSYGGLSLVNVIANAYGLLSAKVIAVASGGGNPSGALMADIQAFLISRTILETMDVRFVASTITAKNVTSAAKMKTGYTWANIQPYFRLAWKLFFAETGQEILDTFLSYGVSSAIDKINAILSESFTSADYTAVTKLLDGLSNAGARSFGETIQISDAYSFIQANIDGIDYITISSPSFPITLADDEITTYGSLSLTEIP